MTKVGTIKQIWRYPVKGMAGELLESCALGERGLSGDRIWALRDMARKEIQSCKFRPQLLLCTARVRHDSPNEVDITFPDGSVVGSDNDAVHAKLSALTDRPSTLVSVQPESNPEFYRRHKRDDYTWREELAATFEREPGEPLPDLEQLPAPMVEFVSLLGTFFLVTPLHLVTTSTLAHLKKINPQPDWDVRRFRPNLVIETEPSGQGLLEQNWVGKSLVIGESRIDCAAPTPRCGAITRPQAQFGLDKTILRTVVNEADQNVGVYGVITGAGRVRVGDVVHVEM